MRNREMQVPLGWSGGLKAPVTFERPPGRKYWAVKYVVANGATLAPHTHLGNISRRNNAPNNVEM
jgi:hypothetical protein